MILAEKIMGLRKRMGWSQEELTQQLGVSRQSVSKWEAAQSIPDVTKITQMSELFGVTTDYLLKEGADDSEIITTATPDEAVAVRPAPHGRAVSLEEANEYLDLVRATSQRIAVGAALCVWSPIANAVLSSMAAANAIDLPSAAAEAVGGILFLLLVGIAVFVFILNAMRLKPYKYLDEEEITLEYGVEAAVARKRDSFASTFRMSIAIGVALIVVGIITGMASEMFNDALHEDLAGAFLLLFVGVSVYLFVRNASINGSYKKLLQIEDYTPESKAIGKRLAWFSIAYWCTVVALYLAYSFIANSWDTSWVVWPVAGVLFVAVYVILRQRTKSHQ